jgi:hypothetical protein
MTNSLILPPFSQQSISEQLRAYFTGIGIVWAVLFIASISDGDKDHLQNVYNIIFQHPVSLKYPKYLISTLSSHG